MRAGHQKASRPEITLSGLPEHRRGTSAQKRLSDDLGPPGGGKGGGVRPVNEDSLLLGTFVTLPR